MRKILLYTLMSVAVWASDVFGTITKIQGSPRADKKVLKAMEEVFTNQLITTDNHSRVIIKQKNGNIIAIGKNSVLKLDDKSLVNQKKGNIFFNIAKKATKFQKYSFKIKIKTATMGVRGTNFIVKNDNENEEILLREGKLEFMAKNNAFALYKEKIENEFNSFKNEFNEYKSELMNEFDKYKKEENYQFEKFATKFNLQESSLVILKDQKAFRAKLDKDLIKAKFKEFDEFVK